MTSDYDYDDDAPLPPEPPPTVRRPGPNTGDYRNHNRAGWALTRAGMTALAAPSTRWIYTPRHCGYWPTTHALERLNAPS